MYVSNCNWNPSILDPTSWPSDMSCDLVGSGEVGRAHYVIVHVLVCICECAFLSPYMNIYPVGSGPVEVFTEIIS